MTHHKNNVTVLLFATNNGKEHVESNLNTIDKDETVLGGDELEVDGVNYGPHFPRSLTGGEKVTLDLVSNGGQRIAVHQTEVREEDSHKDGAPEDLVNGNLGEHSLGISTRNLAIEPVVEVVTRRSVVNESKD